MPVPQILSTKTQPPILPPGVVPRPHLVDRLAQGRQRKLTLISAPAGFGKTTLLCEWIAGRDQPVAWLSLDEADCDPTRFWAYFSASLAAAYHRLDVPLFAVPDQLIGPAGHEQLLIPLMNSIAATDECIVVILDDYHLIRSSSVHHDLTYLILNQPANLHLVLATRADPPLPLARLRAQGQLNEIRQDHLQFTAPEAEAFFQRALRRPLSPENVHLLTSKAEGWPVGMRLASLSLNQEQHPSTFVQDFAGTDRHIVEFLIQEVLSGQPQKIQDFMLQTSILDQMSGPLCTALTGVADSADLLQRMEQANLFLVALDRDRQWFRYHRLFADLLQSLLRRRHAEAIPLLHRRASQWFEEHGHPHSAIAHALAAGDMGRCAALVESAAEAALMRSEAYTLLSWTDILPDREVRRRPLLCAYHAAALLPSGESRALVRERLDQADLAAEGKASSEALAVRGVLAGLSGDLQTSIDLSRKALELLPQDSLYFRSICVDNLGITYFLQGDHERAIESLDQAVRLAQRSGNTLTGVGAICRLAGLHMTKGNLRKAAQFYEQALVVAQDESGRSYPIAGKALVGLGEIQREWNQLEQATHSLHRGIELISLLGEVGAIVGHISLAFIEQASGHPSEASDHMREAQDIARRFDASELDDRMVAACAARLNVAQTDLRNAHLWVEQWDVDQHDDLSERSATAPQAGVMADLQQLERTVLARLYLAEGLPDRALELLRQASDAASQQGRGRRHIEALMLQSLALQSMGRQDDALTSLTQALILAQPEGYLRVFADEGMALRPLLLKAIEAGTAVDYASTLLEVVDSEHAPSAQPSRSPSLPEPLTSREVEVLRLLSTHLSSSEIADELMISANTARFHIKNIYGKLGAHSRNQAIARARELRLI